VFIVPLPQAYEGAAGSIVRAVRKAARAHQSYAPGDAPLAELRDGPCRRSGLKTEMPGAVSQTRASVTRQIVYLRKEQVLP
jgi:hypothetical protein